MDSSDREAQASHNQVFAIIGAGQAGYWASKTLRAEGFDGKIILIGDEQHPPYERPPLSKSVLMGTEQPDVTYFGSAEDVTADNVEWQPSTQITAIDRETQKLSLSNGGDIRYDKLLMATGGRARKLARPGSDLPGIHYIRTIDDCMALQPMLQSGEPLVVIGGGWIGLEIAASATKRGMKVTLIEMAPQLCNRALPLCPADHLRQLHIKNGVDIRLNTGIDQIIGQDAVEGVVLSTGEVLKTRTILAGIGMLPNSELAESCGITVNDGILIDEFCRTSDPKIYAAGDVARYSSARSGGTLRLESWANAQNQSVAAAKSMAGTPTAYDPVPWFWSDQFDMNLQVVGIPSAKDLAVMRGRTETGSFSIFYLDAGGHLVAAISFNASRDNKIAKRLIEQNKIVDASKLSDPDFSLQKLLA